MSKRKDEEKDENSKVTWTYSGVEEEWDSFDRRMVRFMRQKFDDFGEKLWMDLKNPVLVRGLGLG